MFNREMINGIDMFTITAYFVIPGRPLPTRLFKYLSLPFQLQSVLLDEHCRLLSMKEQEQVSFFKMDRIHCNIPSRCHFGRVILAKQSGLEEPVTRRWASSLNFLVYLTWSSIRIGTHYWYDNHLNMNCSEFLPSFVMYNKGQLSAFGWSIVSKLDFSRRVEFPPKSAIHVRVFLAISIQ